MDARYLLYDSNMFDLIFSFSSIEHFGSRDDIKQAMAEIGRVLKPGGIAVIATEIVLNHQPHPEFFRTDELVPCLAEPGGLELVEEKVDLNISQSLLDKPLQWDEREGVFPHITLQIGDVIFTSVSLILRKPESVSADNLLQVDSDLRLALSRIKLNLFEEKQPPPLPQLQMQINRSKVDNIPIVGNAFRAFKYQFHQLIIFYLLPVFEYIHRFAEYHTSSISQDNRVYFIERLILKSELTASRSEIQDLQTKIEILEQRMKELQDLNVVTYD
jgi:SAM-dependent methyltransferase